jgi:catechol 2,3-dioxygenase
MRQSVSAIRAVEMELADPDRAAAFFTGVWNLSEVARDGGAIYLRSTCAFHHVLAIHPSGGPARVRRVVFDAGGRALVDALYARVAATVDHAEAPRPLQRAGGGYGFGFADARGRGFAVICDAEDHADDGKVADRPYKIAHVNLNDTDARESADFFTETLGFRCVDHSGPQLFLNCDSTDHSSVVVCQAEHATLNHIAFEMADLESVMRGAGRMRDHGYPIEWGVGRHGPGNNSFAYFAGPEEIPLEYTADVQQIDDTYEFHGPDYWKWPPGRLDQWGVTAPHSQRWKRVQSLFDFAPDAGRLARDD